MKKLNLLLISIASLLTGCSNKSASIGIIGGADGPTAIFVASKLNWYNIVLAIIIIMVVLYLIKGRK